MKARLTFLSTLLSFWMGAQVALAEGGFNEKAQKHFDAGLAYAEDPSGPKWEEALKEFLAAYAENPTWKLKNNIGLCSLHLERDGDAISSYKEYLDHGGEKGLSEQHRKQIERDIAMLSASLVRVTIDVEPAEVDIIDERKNSKGELRINRYKVQGGKASLGIHPGIHKITIEAEGHVSDAWTFEAEPASTHQHRFKLASEKTPAPAPSASGSPAPVQSSHDVEPPKSEGSQVPTSVYVSLAAAGVLSAAATTTGVIALGKNKDYDNTRDPAERDRLKKSGDTFVLLTDIGIGGAVLSLGATAYLYFSAPKVTSAESGQSQLAILPVVNPNAAGMAISGKF